MLLLLLLLSLSSLYTDVWNDLTEKMGYWVDMQDPYITYKPKYMESV